jgi:hypothetical protein
VVAVGTEVGEDEAGLLGLQQLCVHGGAAVCLAMRLQVTRAAGVTAVLAGWFQMQRDAACAGAVRHSRCCMCGSQSMLCAVRIVVGWGVELN